MMKKAIILSLFSVIPLTSICQDTWRPTGNWPFANKRFEVATVYSGFFTPKKTIVPCNIHVGNQTLWYAQNDTLMEAIPGSILRVEFPDSSVYVPVNNEKFGKIIHQDEGGRVIKVEEVDYKTLNKDAAQRNLNAFTLDGAGAFSTFTIDMIGSYESNPEDLPLPLHNDFYFVVGKEIFQVTEGNIIKHIPADKKKDFRAFLRSAEIIMQNESSIMKIWNRYFAPQKK